jgi:hypothetical protein
MQEYIKDNTIPKDVPAFAKSFFTKLTGGGFIHATKSNDLKKPNATQPTVLNEGGGGKRKLSSDKQEGGKEQPKKEFSNKGCKMGLFHLKKGTPAAKALPKKCILKDSVSMYLDFCCHERKCNHPHALCKNGKHYTNWKKFPIATRSPF